MLPSVVHFVDSFHQGGSESQAVALACRQQASGRFRAVRVAALKNEGVLRAQVEQAGISIDDEFRLTSFYDANFARQLARAVKFLRTHNFDVLHTHDFYTNIFGMFAATLARVPVRIASRRETGGIRTANQRRLERIAYSFAHAIVTNAEAVRAEVTGEGIGAHKVTTIYNGLDMKRVALDESQRVAARAKILREYNLPDTSLIVTIVANMRLAVKNQAMFLRMARRVAESVPHAAFILAGEGELQPELERLAREYGLQDKAIFTGRCENVAEVLAASDVCALTSFGEGFSNALLEYMAAGCPVVATDVGGAREAVIEGETGYLVQSDDDAMMAERVIALLRAPQRARAMGARGREIVEQTFSTQTQLERTHGLYVRLLNTHAGIHNTAQDNHTSQDNQTPPARHTASSLASHPTASRDSSHPSSLSSSSSLSSPARVLIVAASLDILGGQAVQAAQLCERFAEDKQIEIGFLPVNPRLPGVLRGLQNIKYVRTLVTSLYYIASLLWRVRGYDVIHIFSASYLSFVIAPTPAILTGKFYGKRTLLNYHSGEAEDHLHRWRRSAIPTLRLCDMIAVPSAYLVEVFAKFDLEARAVFNFVDTSQFRFRRRHNLRPVFLSNRNLEALYNVGCTLRAFALIQHRYPEARLIIAGDGSQRLMLETLARELELNNVEFVGRTSPEKMPALYDTADIFLNASDIDNMPLSIIEAFAAGTPVVTTDAGGIPFIVTHEKTGLLVGRNDAGALANAALRLLEDAELAARLISNAHAESARYTWQSVRDEWLNLYRELRMTPYEAKPYKNSFNNQNG